METLGKFIVGGIVSTLSYMWLGYVLCVLWGWFIVTTFALPALDIPSAIGLAIIVSFLTWQYNPTEAETDWFSVIFLAIFRPALSLLAGWIVQLFM